jgi:hypothetical protein
MTNEFKSDCLAIIKLAMETPETKAHIMCEWVAHCQFFSVRVYMGGWSLRTPDLSAECHDLDVKKYTPAYHAEPSLVLAKIQALLA